MTDIKGNIHSIETFGSVDGPGIRFIVFLKGCDLRCMYCHNADTWEKGSDDQRTADEILKQALRYKTYWGEDGGITVSGGEPLLQMEFLTDLHQGDIFTAMMLQVLDHIGHQSVRVIPQC